METPLIIEFICFMVAACVLAAAVSALNTNCKKSEELNDRLIEFAKEITQQNSELEDENRRLKADLLYERTKDNANTV